MREPFGDARVEELKMLSAIDRADSMLVRCPPGPRRDLVVHLVAERLVNDLALLDDVARRSEPPSSGMPGESNLERELQKEWVRDLMQVGRGEEVSLRLTHKGRVRLSELKQALRSGKTRDSFDILWDVRHLDRDLQVAVLEASDACPLSVGYLDMNGLKAINDTGGHDAGDAAVRAFLQTVSSLVGDRGDAYRVGGDEVVVLLPSHKPEEAKALLRNVCQSLMGERLAVGDSRLPELSASVGISTVVNPQEEPSEVKQRADRTMYRAKAEAHKLDPRPSAIAVEGTESVDLISSAS
jgi:diguanylate cyclase (GGDEF)-like protein